MHLFHAISTYQLLSMIIYRNQIHTSEKTTLMITNTLINKFPQYKLLHKYYDNIIVYDISIPISGSSRVESQINKYFKNIFNNNDIDINSVKNIYLGCAHYYFGLYLAINEIPFTFFEDASGLLSNPEVLMNIEKDKYPIKYSLNIKYGLYDASCKFITKKVCNVNAQKDGFSDNKAQHFDVVREYLKLSQKDQNDIKYFFSNVDNIDIDKDSVLFLTQHFVGLSILEFEEQILIYQLVIDYFFNDKNIVFKTHPDDVMYYGELFPTSKVIRQKFPSEFLPVIFNNRPNEIATITSTSINNLYQYFDKTFNFDMSFEKYFKSIHKYYAAIMMIKKTKSMTIKYLGTNKKLIDNLISHAGIEFENISISCINKLYIEEKCTYIIDNIKDSNFIKEEDLINLLDGIPESSEIIFINSDYDYCFYNYEYKYLWNYITPINIKKIKVKKEDVYENEGEEVIYFYSKDKEKTIMAETLTYKKELESTGIEVLVSELTEDQRRIKVLEGILKATEKRLLHYIKLVKENNKQEV